SALTEGSVIVNQPRPGRGARSRPARSLAVVAVALTVAGSMIAVTRFSSAGDEPDALAAAARIPNDQGQSNCDPNPPPRPRPPASRTADPKASRTADPKASRTADPKASRDGDPTDSATEPGPDGPTDGPAAGSAAG